MPPKMAEETDSKRIESVSLYRPKLAATGSATSKKKKKGRRFHVRLYHVVFLAAYIYQMGWVVSTIGKPYRDFLEKADREGFKGECNIHISCLQESALSCNAPTRTMQIHSSGPYVVIVYKYEF